MGTEPPPPVGARVPVVDVSYVDTGRSRFSNSGISQGAHRRHFIALMVGAPGSPALAHPRGDRHRRFLALMVGTPESPAQAPPGGPIFDVFYVDGGCS
jgi:hypothetical protein